MQQKLQGSGIHFPIAAIGVLVGFMAIFGLMSQRVQTDAKRMNDRLISYPCVSLVSLNF
jgi:hypothetical protein